MRPTPSSASSFVRDLLLMALLCHRGCPAVPPPSLSSLLSSRHSRLDVVLVPPPPPRRSVAFVRSPAGWMWFGVVSLGALVVFRSFVVLPAGLRRPSRWYLIGNNNDKIKTYLLRVPTTFGWGRAGTGSRVAGSCVGSPTRSSSSFHRSRVDVVWCGWAQRAVGSRYLQEKNKNNKKKIITYF